LSFGSGSFSLKLQWLTWSASAPFRAGHTPVSGQFFLHSFCGPSFTVEYPTGSGSRANLEQVAHDLARRLAGIFREGPDGRRPVHGGAARFDKDPGWHNLIPLHQYFHGDTGAGLGASHQTGWTALIVDLLLRPPRGHHSAQEEGGDT